MVQNFEISKKQCFKSVVLLNNGFENQVRFIYDFLLKAWQVSFDMVADIKVSTCSESRNELPSFSRVKRFLIFTSKLHWVISRSKVLIPKCMFSQS